MIHLVAEHDRRRLANACIFEVSRLEKEGPAMPFDPIVFTRLLKPISRRRFLASVERHDADAYDKNFSSWDHLVALVFAQLSGAGSLRGLEAGWAANGHHHYHLGAGRIARSTLSDASGRRPVAVFEDTFSDLARLAGRQMRRVSEQLVQLIDSSPIPLGTLHAGRGFNGRIKGAKMHLVYDPQTNIPQIASITPANVNDITFAHTVPVQPEAVYVFDKGYCSLSLWQKIHDAGAVFVTRPKANAAFETVGVNVIHPSDNANIIADEIVYHRSKNTWRGTLDFHMRRLTVRRDDGKLLQIITNDLTRSASNIADLYRQRWQIELLFRWIKQHLKIRRFLGRSENAVKLQIYAALIAYLLLRLAARLARREDIQPIRFAELAAASLFFRKPIEHIDKPSSCRTQILSHNPQQMSLKLNS
jgi:IS4 transposase